MIEINNLSKTYGKESVSVHALQNVSLRIEQGEFTAIMGASGSGKSTLLHLLGLLDRPDAGSYKLFGTEVSKLSDDELAYLRNNFIGFVFQQFHLLRRTTAQENVELPLVYAGKTDIGKNAIAKLESVGLASRKNHFPNELSGGEQQRVAIARALVNDPPVIFADEPTGNLDTKSEEEIIKILKKLNEQGKTIVMVTHEQEIAAHAQRVITMKDGQIISDQKRNITGQQNEKAKPVKEVFAYGQSHIGQIEVAEHVKQSFRSMLMNKVRSFLSMLGILFGVGAVIAMLALGQGAKASMEQRLKSLGSNLLIISGGPGRHGPVSQAVGSFTRFTFSDVEAIRRMKTLVKKVSGYVSRSCQMVYKSENWNTTVEGVGYSYAEMRAAAPIVGRWFTQEEIKARDKVVILGQTVITKLFKDRNPVGEIVKINRINFKVIGVAPAKGSMGPRDQDDIAYIPITTAMYRLMGKDYIDTIFIEAADAESIENTQENISKLIVKRHRITGNPDDSFHVRNMSEMQQMLLSTTKTMSILLGCIAAISLLVGGIGIMNIMLVSVTERTREIGLRKAIGARAKDIMTQFLIEAVVMTLSGGIMGMVLGVACSVILSAAAGWATKVTISNIILATGFSAAVGIFFGLWPAKKASELNPIEALRYE